MTAPKGMVPDHWTWRDGRAEVTGWHAPKRRGKAKDEPDGPVFVPRGLVTGTTKPPKRSAGMQGKLL